MRMMKKIKPLLLTALIMCMAGSAGRAQVSRSAYFLEDLPASSLLNPAHHPNCKLYVNLPVISSFYIGFDSPFSFDDLTSPWPQGDSLYIDREKVLLRLQNRNYFNFELYNELGLVGVNLGRHYLNFGIAKVFFTKFVFDDDLMRLMLYGNGSPGLIGKRMEIDRNGLNITSYHQFGLGYGLRVNDKLTLGVKLKYLNGAFNVWMKKASFSLYTEPGSGYPLTVSSDIELYTSSTISDFDDMIDQIEGYKWFDMSGNHGYAMDLGVKYFPAEKLGLSASVVDLGSITWKENVKNFNSHSPAKDYTFTGFDLTDFVIDGSVTDTAKILDTLKVHFGLTETHAAYTSHLTPKGYLGGRYNPTKKDALSLLVRNDFVEGTWQPGITAGYQRKFFNFLTLYINYSVISRSYSNIGLGAIIETGVFQFFILNDMAYALMEPALAKNYNLHFGIGFKFWKEKEEPAMEDTDIDTQPDDQD
ncbi:MAG: hypothetical protein JXA03_11125 [Bacteroidales bacterium]|nr:hypothetical protein [Bacteroidales bacterium]